MRRVLALVGLLLVPSLALATDVTDLPIAETLSFPQLSAPVDIVRDSLGVPHIYASTLEDGSFVLGYIHAKERMFQMDVFRRIPSGTVAELLGFPDFQVGAPNPTDPPFPGNISNVTQDLFFQTLGLRRSAEDSFNALSPTSQSVLQTYADGVNEYINFANQTGNLPAEYGALHVTSIKSWDPVDSIAFAKLQAFELSFDFDDELTDDVADVTGALGMATGETAFYQDLARSQPAFNAFTVPDANNAPIPLSALTTTKSVMVARADAGASAATDRAGDAPAATGAPETAAAGTTAGDTGTTAAAKAATTTAGKAGAAEAGKTAPVDAGKAEATLVARAHDAGGAADPAARARQRAVAAARKATVAKARAFIAQLMQQPAMRGIRERGVVGSNEWVVAGSNTDTGNPILANDPHLGLGSPATFYELHINTKDRGGTLNVTGIGFAGAPGVVQGHNESIAWGSTTNPTDVTDWYLEDISSNGSGQLFSHYLGSPEAITELPLQVKVNADNGLVTGIERGVLAGALGLPIFAPLPPSPIDVTPLLATFVPAKVLVVGRHGPIFPQTLQPFPFPNSHSGGSAISIQFTGLFPTREIDTFITWNQATNLTEFKQGLQLFDFGSQNWSYADVAGNIGYFASGEFPIREDIDAGAIVGNPPALIRDGTGGNEWKALGGPQPADQAVPYAIVDAADVPQVENPPAGWFVSANNDPIGNTADNDPYNEALAGTAPYLSFAYDDLRAARITEMIRSELNLIATPPGTPAGDGTISFADMQRMQADVNQLEGRRLAGYFVTAVNDAELGGAPPQLAGLVNARIQDARDRLAAWTYNTPAGFDTTGDPGTPSSQDLIDSVATTIFNTALGKLVTNTFDATLAANGVGYRQGTTEAVRGLLKVLDAGTFTGVGASGLNFFDDPSVSLTAEQERDVILVKSLQQALDLLAGASFANAYANSTDVDDYLWGRVHYIIFDSFIDGDLNATFIPGGGAFSIPPQPAVGFPPGEPANGARSTVDVAGYGLHPSNENSFRFGSGPNRRAVVEMSPGAIVAKNVIPGGDQGEPGKPGYGNQIDDWLSNQTHDSLLYTADVVAAAASRESYPPFDGCTEGGVGHCVPGKGSTKTDCIAEFFVDTPVDALAIKKAKIEMTDGGSSDFDGEANGVCIAHVLLCLNNDDPRIVNAKTGVQCPITDVDVFELKKPHPLNKKPEDVANANRILDAARSLAPGGSTTTGTKGNVIEYTTPVTAHDDCATLYLAVPLKGPDKKGKKSFKLRATDLFMDAGHVKKTKDNDSLKITCLPSV
jgi:penicillin G amidase